MFIYIKLPHLLSTIFYITDNITQLRCNRFSWHFTRTNHTGHYNDLSQQNETMPPKSRTCQHSRLHIRAEHHQIKHIYAQKNLYFHQYLQKQHSRYTWLTQLFHTKQSHHPPYISHHRMNKQYGKRNSKSSFGSPQTCTST